MIVLLILILLNVSMAAREVVPLAFRDRVGEISPRPLKEKPKEIELNAYAEYFDRLVILKFNNGIDLVRQYRNIADKPVRAMNVNPFDEVDNSSWFTNRNGVERMSIEDIKRGPDRGPGPDISRALIVIKAKTQGVTPGFLIKDCQGDRYMVKFDPPAYQELASGAEVVSTKLFYGSGYFVPENYIVWLNPDSLRLGEKVKLTDEKGRKRLMTRKDLANIVNKIPRNSKGEIRALASLFLSGSPIGPFRYQGVREDDPNDLVPHEHRRELRGLRVVCAWLNHFDTKDGNSLDTWVEENGTYYVKHHLIDFGATLGSASHGPNKPWRGFVYDVDYWDMLKNFLTLGLFVNPWEKFDSIEYSSIGYYPVEFFHPGKYKPQVPNPAFENMTLEDAFWGVKIVMSFSDEQIEAAVETGEYSDSAAKTDLIKRIIRRRDKTGIYWLNKMNPCGDFQLKKKEGKNYLVFSDFREKYGLYEVIDKKYLVSLYDIENNLMKRLVMNEDRMDLSVLDEHGIGSYLMELAIPKYKDQKVKITINFDGGCYRIKSIERDFH